MVAPESISSKCEPPLPPDPSPDRRRGGTASTERNASIGVSLGRGDLPSPAVGRGVGVRAVSGSARPGPIGIAGPQPADHPVSAPADSPRMTCLVSRLGSAWQRLRWLTEQSADLSWNASSILHN